MSTEKVLLGLLAGFAAGATLGVLFAPAKGSSTRQNIVKTGADLVSDFESKFNDLAENISSKFDALRKDSVRIAHNGKTKLDDILAESTPAGK